MGNETELVKGCHAADRTDNGGPVERRDRLDPARANPPEIVEEDGLKRPVDDRCASKLVHGGT
jgi:hypothetical protein